MGCVHSSSDGNRRYIFNLHYYTNGTNVYQRQLPFVNFFAGRPHSHGKIGNRGFSFISRVVKWRKTPYTRMWEIFRDGCSFASSVGNKRKNFKFQVRGKYLGIYRIVSINLSHNSVFSNYFTCIYIIDTPI